MGGGAGYGKESVGAAPVLKEVKSLLGFKNINSDDTEGYVIQYYELPKEGQSGNQASVMRKVAFELHHDRSPGLWVNKAEQEGHF